MGALALLRRCAHPWVCRTQLRKTSWMSENAREDWTVVSDSKTVRLFVHITDQEYVFIKTLKTSHEGCGGWVGAKKWAWWTMKKQQTKYFDHQCILYMNHKNIQQERLSKEHLVCNAHSSSKTPSASDVLFLEHRSREAHTTLFEAYAPQHPGTRTTRRNQSKRKRRRSF